MQQVCTLYAKMYWKIFGGFRTQKRNFLNKKKKSKCYIPAEHNVMNVFACRRIVSSNDWLSNAVVGVCWSLLVAVLVIMVLLYVTQFLPSILTLFDIDVTLTPDNGRLLRFVSLLVDIVDVYWLSRLLDDEPSMVRFWGIFIWLHSLVDAFNSSMNVNIMWSR